MSPMHSDLIKKRCSERLLQLSGQSLPLYGGGLGGGVSQAGASHFAVSVSMETY